MKILGRIVARGPKTAGLFIPMGDCDLKGIYQVVEILDELTIQRIGDPNMPRKRFEGLDLEGLLSERPNCAMTEEELQAVDDSGEHDTRWKWQGILDEHMARHRRKEHL